MIKIIINEYRTILIPYGSIEYIDTIGKEIKELFIKFKKTVPVLGEGVRINLEGYNSIFNIIIHKLQHNSFVEIYIKVDPTKDYFTYCIDIEKLNQLAKEHEEKYQMLQTLKETLKNPLE